MWGRFQNHVMGRSLEVTRKAEEQYRGPAEGLCSQRWTQGKHILRLTQMALRRHVWWKGKKPTASRTNGDELAATYICSAVKREVR